MQTETKQKPVKKSKSKNVQLLDMLAQTLDEEQLQFMVDTMTARLESAMAYEEKKKARDREVEQGVSGLYTPSEEAAMCDRIMSMCHGKSLGQQIDICPELAPWLRAGMSVKDSYYAYLARDNSKEPSSAEVAGYMIGRALVDCGVEPVEVC